MRRCSVICGPRASLRAWAANDTTRAQINNIPSKSHFIIIINKQGQMIPRMRVSKLCCGLELNGFLKARMSGTEMNFWKVNVSHIHGVHKPSMIVHPNVSISACGSFIALDGKAFHQNWSDCKRSQSSTFRELLAFCLCKRSLIPSVPRPLVCAQITRMLHVLCTLVPRFQLCSGWL